MEGIVRVQLFKLLNALPPISVTLAGIIVFLQPNKSLFVAVSIMALQLSRESNIGLPSATFIDAALMRPSNAYSPKDVTLAGSSKEVKPLHT